MNSIKSQVVSRVLGGAGALTALVAVVGAGRKWA